MRRGHTKEYALWLILFSITSLTIMLAAAPVAVSYNLVIVLPGILVFFLASDTFLVAIKLPPSATPILGILQLITAVFLFKMRLGSANLSMAALALIALVLIISGCMLYGLGMKRKHQANGVAAGHI